MNTRIRVVLVEPEIAENLGFVARLCANFSMTDLVLVNPKVSPDDEAARCTAVHAKSVLEHARVVESLRDAVSDRQILVGFTAKASDPRHSARSLSELDPIQVMGEENVALVFGREASGLTRLELEQCHRVVSIPTSDEYPSLNLSHAVAIVLYWALPALAMSPLRELKRAPHLESRASGHERDKILQLWGEVLDVTGFSHDTNSVHNTRELMRCLAHMQPTSRQAAILMGLARQILWKVDVTRSEKVKERPEEQRERQGRRSVRPD
jgi:TrmH family RNA methyltransferase